MEWKDAIICLPPTDRPSLILLEDGSQHVGYPEDFDPYNSPAEWKWIVGGWENCYYCGGESRIVFRAPQFHERRGTHWMSLPLSPEKINIS